MSILPTENKKSILRQSTLLRSASSETISNLAENAIEIEAAMGETILYQGDVSNEFYFISEGEVEVSVATHPIKTLVKGDVFGLYPLADFGERSADIIATKPSKLLKLTGENFFKAAETDPGLIKGLALEISTNSRNLLSLHQIIATQRDEIEKQKMELAELNKTKDKLFSIMGHDLRSPVASIITLIEILISDLDDMQPDDIRSMLNDISQLSQIHLKLLENLLQWARLHTGATKVCIEPILLSDILDETLDFCEYKLKAKDITLNKKTEYNSRVRADKNMVQTVLRNLITNAAKFTPRGGTVTLSTQLFNDHEVVVTVSDTGIGMNQEQTDRLFRLDKVQSRYGTENEAGTGLGLIICHDFIKKIGGKIWVESNENQGSSFSFTIPL